MQVCSEAEVRDILDPERAILILEKAFREEYAKSVQLPLRIQMQTSSGSVLLVMPCYDSRSAMAAIKIVSVRDSNQSKTDRVDATLFLVEQETGKPFAVIAANYLTDIRTAATSAVATKYLARSEVSTLGIFGTGRQALAHVLLLRHVRDFSRVLICGSTPARSEEFAALLKNVHGLPAASADVTSCARNSDVICTCTTSKSPLFDGHLIRSGTHLNLIGAFQRHRREVDDHLVGIARIVVDTYEGALQEAGDLLIPLEHGVIKRTDIVADLHELVCDKHVGRRDDQEITIFKSVGCAFEDLVIANSVYQDLARREVTPGIATVVKNDERART